MNNYDEFLFIHGAGGSSTKWRSVKSYMNEQSCSFVDLPGHGNSNEKISLSIEEYASHLEKEINDDTIVIGHSMGGLIAIELAARSKKVNGLVLASSFYELPVHPKFLEELANGNYPESFFYASYSKNADEGLLNEEKEELANTQVEIALADFQACDNYKKGAEAFAAIKIPILALFGSEDRLVPKNAQQLLVEKNERTKIETITGAGHYVNLEEPEKFVNEVLKYREHCQNVKK